MTDEVNAVKPLLLQAVAVYRNVYRADPKLEGSSFTLVDAMNMVGVPANLAGSRPCKERMERMLKGNPPVDLKLTEEAKVERSIFLLKNAKFDMDGSSIFTKAKAMRLAGSTKEETTGNTKLYARLGRRLKDIEKENKEREDAAAAQRENDTLANSILGGDNTIAKCKTPSQDTSSSGLGYESSNRVPMKTIDVARGQQSQSGSSPTADSPLSYDAASFASRTQSWSSATASNSGSMSQAAPLLRPKAKSTSQSISKATVSTAHRKSSKEAHKERQDEMEVENMRKSAFKVATVLYNGVMSGQNPLEKFVSADKCAHETNVMFEFEILSGYTVKEGVKNGLTGKSPPRRGPQTKIPDDEFKMLCALAFTCESIEQANCAEQRLERPKIISMIGTIVNECLESRGEMPLNEISFYNRIQKFNSQFQDVSKVDPREARRVAWLRYQAQLLNHERWEEALVYLGMARLPIDNDEREEKGYIVLYDGQLDRIVVYDEYNLTSDGSDQGRGGRPACTHTNPKLPEAGKPAVKSGNVVTVMQGVTLGCEALPPYIMYKSMAELPKASLEFMACLPQILGQYGFPEKRFFDVPYTGNKPGGMNNMAHRLWHQHIRTYYPDAADVPGKRVITKSDSGPGRFDSRHLMECRVDGFHCFQGLPNGTEIGAEMDQLFGYNKTLVYGNMDTLITRKWELEGPNAQLSLTDMASCIFGCDVTLKDGEVVTLEKAYEKAFSRERIMSARDKCGYAPATRNSLKSEKLRHEAVLDEHGEAVLDADPLGELLMGLEKDNHEAFNFLLNRGYAKESLLLLKRSIKRVTANQVKGRESVQTAMNTSERQEQLMGFKTAGQYFSITQGGAPTTCNDMLIKIEREHMLAEATKLEARKTKIIAFKETEKEGRAVLANGKEPSEWTVSQLKAAIKWKQGPFAARGEGLSKHKQDGLKRVWDTKFVTKPAPTLKWTAQDEDKLQHLKSGEVPSLEKMVTYQRAMATQADFLATRLVNIPPSQQIAVLSRYLADLPLEQRQHVLAQLGGDSCIMSTAMDGMVADSNEDIKTGLGSVVDESCADESVADESIADESVADESDDDESDDELDAHLFDESDGEESDVASEKLDEEEGDPEEIQQKVQYDLPSLRKKEWHTDEELRFLLTVTAGTARRPIEGLCLLDVETLKRNIEQRDTVPESHSNKDPLVSQLTELITSRACGAAKEAAGDEEEWAAKAARQAERAAVEAARQEEATRLAASLLRPLTDDEREIVRNALYSNEDEDPTKILVKVGPSHTVQRQSMHRLQPGQWLNDETINAFHSLLDQRDKELCKLNPGNRKRNHWFHTTFVTTLLNEGNADPSLEGKYDYKNVKGWSKNVPGKSIFKLGKIFIPINIGQMHWVCAMVNMVKKKIYMYDSMGGSGMSYLESIFQYIQDEYAAKNRGAPLPDINKWDVVGRPLHVEIANQENGWDCGVFECMYSYFLSEDLPLVFNQDHIDRCRERIALCLMKGTVAVM